MVSRTDDEERWMLEVSANGYATSCVDELPVGYGIYNVGPVILFRPVGIEGNVRDARGAPVSGAQVYAALGHGILTSDESAGVARVAETDATGHFAFESLPPGRVTVGVTGSSFADAVKPAIVVHAGARNVVNFDLVPERVLRGHILDVDGSPVADAIVESLSVHSPWRRPALSDRKGTFQTRGFDRRANSSVRVAAKGYVIRRLALDESLDVLEVCLTRSRSFLVKVRAARGSEEPPAILGVEIRDASEPSSCGTCERGHWTRAESDASYYERLSSSSWRIYWESALTDRDIDDGREASHPRKATGGDATALCIRLSDGSIHIVAIDERQRKDADTVITIDAPVSGSIEGQVRDASSGLPVSGVLVQLNHWSVIQPQLQVVSDELGEFRFDGIAPNDVHDVSVNTRRWRGKTPHLTVVAGQATRGVTLEVLPAPVVRGRVTRAGKPLREDVVFGLGYLDDGRPVSIGYLGIGVCDKFGNLILVPKYDRQLAVVPKRGNAPSLGGYRRFLSEFETDVAKSWPWQVASTPTGEVWIDIDLPSNFDRR
jgi:protocatechuate 3,4-dioxygenase beta subunit